MKDKKGSENVVVDHLSRLEQYDKLPPDKGEINDQFMEKFLFFVEYVEPSWYTDIANHLVCGVMPQELTYSQRKKFLSEVQY